MKKNTKRILSALCLIVLIVTLVGGVLAPGTTTQAAGTIKHVVGLLNVGDTTIIKGTTTPPSSYGATDTATISLSGSQQYIVGAFVLSNSKINRYEILLQKGNTSFKYSPTETKNHAGLTPELINVYNKQDKTTYKNVNTEWNYIIDTNKLDTGKWTLESWAYTDAGSFCAGRITVNVGAKNISTYNHVSCYEGAIKIGNDYNKVSKSVSYGTSQKYNFRLWVIHDQGLSGYAYKITPSNGGSYSSGSVTLKSSTRTDLADCNVCETLKIGQSASLANTGCNGTVDFSKFKPGKYQIDITATPRKGNAFKVLQINLTITGSSTSNNTVTPAQNTNIRTITYDLQDGTLVSGNLTQSFSGNDDYIILDPPTASKKDYVCYEYSTQPNGEGIRYRIDAEIRPSTFTASNTTLYAHWVTIGNPRQYDEIKEGAVWTNCFWYSLNHITNVDASLGNYEAEKVEKLKQLHKNENSDDYVEIRIDSEIYHVWAIDNEEASIQNNQHRICMRSNTADGKYHFWRQMPNGGWCCKEGYSTATRKEVTNIGAKTVYHPGEEGNWEYSSASYNSDILYFSVEQIQ